MIEIIIRSKYLLDLIAKLLKWLSIAISLLKIYIYIFISLYLELEPDEKYV